MYTLASVVTGVAVKGTFETVLFLSTTCLNRVRSGGFVTLTGPFSSADTSPWSCSVMRLAVVLA